MQGYRWIFHNYISKELMQDKDKEKNEFKMLNKYIPKFKGGIFLDYGCGDGRMNFIYHDLLGHYSSFIGIDPDPIRLQQAKEKFFNEINVKKRALFLNTLFNDKLDYKLKKLENSIDCIICIQVLGHVSIIDFEKILCIFRYLLASHGKLILAIPVVGSNFKFNRWKIGNDFFHIVNLSLDPSHKNFRVLIDPDRIEFFIDTGYLMPVRAFFIPKEIQKTGPFYNISKIAQSSYLGQSLRKYGFKIEHAEIYAKYVDGLGDMIISVGIV